ncbi:hypothetical protein DV738_g4671, partial [Chaetothyriales sp. CBS 135597]
MSVSGSSNNANGPSHQLRVAVEGCGHGTLDQIYTSIEKSCQEKGWDGVDVVIIGGDFQAVRNAYDLNVTAMPQHYRRMADFHKYYSGQRQAPYLTLFVGGNHEASNHLFELYYGGWVAPNIYYLGAANIVNVGPLRISGLSGIFKGYDYRKAHFERLPYNQEDLTTIFHVRELDVRKLLSVRSQVDIGISHDWPEGVVWKGQYRRLFSKKRGFEEDAKSRKLGSIAAKDCLERLRPRYWFSAHLHTKYTAIVRHDSPESNPPGAGASEQGHNYAATPRPEHQEQVSAWHKFQEVDKNAAAAERENFQVTQVNANKPKFTVQETFKRVITDDNLNRTIDQTKHSEWSPTDARPPPPLSQLDGCNCSVPSKRARERSESTETHPMRIHSLGVSQVDGSNPVSRLPGQSIVSNPDAIDIDMSEDDDDNEQGDIARPTSIASTSATIAVYAPIIIPTPDEPNGSGRQNPPEAGGTSLNAAAAPFRSQDEIRHSGEASKIVPIQSALTSTLSAQASNSETHESKPATLAEPVAAEAVASGSMAVDGGDAPKEVQQEPLAGDVSEDLRAELAAMSKSFAEAKVGTSPALPFPEEISNKSTEFLALDKCEPSKQFLQLLEIGSITSDKPVQRPVKLEYDAEWLAILRVFANELELGGKPNDRAPPHRGDTFYNERIAEEKKWVQEQVVGKGLLQVPDNFTITAPVYDPELKVNPSEMPREYTNPQTSRFCELIGIENKFAISEQDREARIAAGPREESDWYKDGQDRRKHGRGGGRGGRGRGFGNPSRGRGRGRGGGRW